ncbi:hypothetical protein JX266_008807 [Neoarthrinium moseri]|nr:hypothetical protein JX266_008807 [Neoarthrinium moseri]
MVIGGFSVRSFKLFGAFFLLNLLPYAICVVGAQELPDLGTVLSREQDLSTYYEPIKKYPQILLQLPTSGGITLIAPSNAAFANIPGTPLNSLWAADKPEIAVPILLYHVLASSLSTRSLAVGTPVYAPTLLQDPAWTSLGAGGQAILVNRQPGNVVVFVSGGGTRSTLKKADIAFKGGLVQIVDNLLIPPGPLNVTLASFQDLSFLGALYAAGLYDELAGHGGGATNGTERSSNYTIFAPSISGFQAVNTTLSNFTREALAAVMRYHVVPSQVLPSTALTNATNHSTLAAALDGQGTQLHVHRAGNNLYINSAQVIQPDILWAGGIIHIIDNVLNPNVPDPVPDPELSVQRPVFEGAVDDVATLSKTGLPFTAALPCSVSCPVASSATVPRTTSSTTVGTSSSKALAARCTGSSGAPGVMNAVAGAAAVGVVLGSV